MPSEQQPGKHTHPSLSLVIAAWNRLPLTRQCLDSLASCPLKLEIILIDNGSEDGTPQGIQDEFPHVKLIRNRTNRGVTAAWRQGVEAASAPLVCVANNDLIFESGCLSRLVEPLERHDWIGVTSPETAIDPDEAVPFFMEAARIPSEPASQDWRIGYTGWCFAFRKADFPENFDPRLFLWYQDKDFLYTLLFKRRGQPPFRWPVPGKVPLVIPGARVRHAYHASHDQLSSAYVKRRTDTDRNRFNRKWRGYRGNRYVYDIDWGGSVPAQPVTVETVAEHVAHIGSDSGPLVSVIIPCYNHPDLLAETLESVARQTYQPVEIIIVDDASQEPLLPAVQTALSAFEGSWRLLRLSRNTGPGIARRMGLEAASGVYIQYLDADDLLHPEKLTRQVDFLNANPDHMMTYAQTGVLGQENSLLGRTDQAFDRILPDLLERIIWTTSSCLWRKSLAGRPDWWYPLYGPEDVLFDFIAGLSDASIGRTPSKEVLLYKREHTGGISAGIADDVTYQQEILKAYDYMNQRLAASEMYPRLKTNMARLYADKVMRFLIFRRYHEAAYCIRWALQIDASRLTRDARLAHHVNALTGSFVAFPFLRRWRWVKKILRRRLSGMKQAAG